MPNHFSEIRRHHGIKVYAKILFVFFSSIIWVLIFRFAYYFGLRKKLQFSWVVGPYEIGDYAQRIASYITESKLFILKENPFSSSFNGEGIANVNPLKQRYFELIKRPILVAEFMASGSSFVYIGPCSYISDCFCTRSLEFSLIKKCGGKIVCVFLGSEIRSPRLFAQLSESLNQDVSTTYLFDGPSGFMYRDEMQLTSDSLSKSAVEFSDLIMNSPVDQISNINTNVTPLFYYLPRISSVNMGEKSRYKTGIIKIVHAPTSTLAKGTPIVRAVIRSLLDEGFDFEYKELINVRNSEVLQELKTADIVLNEFYSFLPGILGIEAMYFNCALLTSADSTIETWLPEGASRAWMRTRYWEIDKNLRQLLNNPNLISTYAALGNEWVMENYSDSNNAVRMKSILDTI